MFWFRLITITMISFFFYKILRFIYISIIVYVCSIVVFDIANILLYNLLFIIVNFCLPLYNLGYLDSTFYFLSLTSKFIQNSLKSSFLYSCFITGTIIFFCLYHLYLKLLSQSFAMIDVAFG